MPQLITALRKFTSGAIKLVFPSSCVHCGREGELLCHICIRESTKIGRDVCRKCAEPLTKPGTCARCLNEAPQLDRLYGSYLYETPIGSAVRAFKFDDVRALGGRLAELFNFETIERSEADFVVPIPMHKSRVRSRGYNQSEILGRKLAKLLNFRFAELLVRTRPTLPQSEQPTAVARRKALSGAFEVKSDFVDTLAGKRILLLDDVYTTGSTIEAAAATLKSSNVKWVGAAVLTVQPIDSLK